jgi:hypothetical protein
MSKHFYTFIICALGLASALPSSAQYIATPPVRDGVITDAEYGNSVVNGSNTNKFTSNNNPGGGTWYMTWDVNNLYVAKTGGSDGEPTILYFDLDPTLPVTGGRAGDDAGNLNGVTDADGLTPALPFRADTRVLINGGNNNRIGQIQRRNGLGGWNVVSSTGLNYAGSGTNREFSISWSALTGGLPIPATFNWFGYCHNTQQGADNYRYDQAPNNPLSFGDNKTKANKTALEFEYYYTVVSTTNGTATKPFSLTSYTFPRTTDNNSFGAIDVWDFTMNSPNRQISRGSTGGTWNIGGSLVVGGGALYFGSRASSYGGTNVGNIRVMGNGILHMDETTQSLFVREDVDLNGGGQFVLSGLQGADLFVGRDFKVTDGIALNSNTPATFQPRGRLVTFANAGVPHTIQTNNPNYLVPFAFLELNSAGAVTLATNTNILIGNKLTFSNGLLYTGNNYVKLDGSAVLTTETTASHIEGNVSITQTLDAASAQSTTQYFGDIGLSLTPQGNSGARGEITVLRVTGSAQNGVGGGSNGKGIQRYFVITSSAPSITNLDLKLVFAYRTYELNGIQENNLALYKSEVGTPGTYTKLTTPPSADVNTHTITYNYQMPLNSGTYLTLGDAVTPLPVKLVAFSAKATAEGAALLRWNTASEFGSKGFAIERQLGAGEAWKSVGFVSSNNSAMGGRYEFLDNSLLVASASPNAYYRLRQEDFSGVVAYSPVEVIARSTSAQAATLVLSPVPVSGPNLSLTFAEAGQAGSQITVSNTQGQRMLHFTTEASTEVSLNVPVEKLAPGVYILSVQTVGQSPRYTRFVKQ